MLTIGLIIAFTLVTLAALVACGAAAGIWFGVKAARPQLLERGSAPAGTTGAQEPDGS